MKIKTACLSFVCPSCNKQYEIFLKKSPDIMIINCISCKALISIYNGKVVPIDEEMVKRIKTAKNKTDAKYIYKLFENHVKTMGEAISVDDVIDLAENLDKCITIDDVMKLICR